jgi:CMP-N-acetylneuraminic acid synthetase
MPEERSIDVDTIIDWHLVELLMKLNQKNES